MQYRKTLSTFAVVIALPLTTANSAIIETGEVFEFEGSIIVGGSEDGTYTINGGSAASARSIGAATGSPSNRGDILVTGPGSQLELTGTGATNHLEVQSGIGNITVADGGKIVGNFDRTQCDPGWCNSFIGNFSGSTSNLTITGEGSEVSGLVNAFVVGQSGFFGDDVGVVGGTTRSEVNVLDGGQLSVESMIVAFTGGDQGDGTESVISSVNVSGESSSINAQSISLGLGANTSAQLNITDGGKVILGGGEGALKLLVGDEDSGISNRVLIDGGSDPVQSALFIDSSDQVDPTFAWIRNGSVQVQNRGAWQNLNSSLVVGGEDLSLLTIDGTNSQVISERFTFIGLDGFEGQSIVSLDGGYLQSDLGLILNSNGFLVGNGDVIGDIDGRGGVIGPGFSPGRIDITGGFTGSAIFDLEIGGSTSDLYDQLIFSGVVDLTDAILNVSFIDDFLPSTLDIFELIGASEFIGSFSPDRITYAGLPPGFDFDFGIDLSRGGFSLITERVTQVPEPSSVVLLIVGLGALAAFRRRSTQQVQ